MAERLLPKYGNPEVSAAIQARLDSVVSHVGEKPTLRRIGQIKSAISQTADQLGMHPLVVLQGVRVAQAQTAEQAIAIERERVHGYAYVGDIHGFTPAKQAEIEEPLLTGSFEQVFFIGDIGGSTKLARLQRLFYQGGNYPTDNLMWNRYSAMAKEAQASGSDLTDGVILSELKQGYFNIASFERVLAGKAVSEEQARIQLSELSDGQILAGIKHIVRHQHYGHYVADLPEEAIETLSQEVIENYARFGYFAQAIREQTGAAVFALEGNWDARLPYDFERGVDKAIPLPIEKRRLYAADFLKEMGVNFLTGIDSVETIDSMHVLVPFDPLIKPIDELELEKLKADVERAKAGNKTITIVAHAVPSWEIHNGTPNAEGKTTAANLMKLIAEIDPDEIVYGHEHFIRKDRDGQLVSADAKYRILIENGEARVEENMPVADLSNVEGSRLDGVLASPLPMSDQLSGSRIATSERLIDTSHGNNIIRGKGGQASPIRVDRPVTKVRDIN